jgi:hypothetical protein
MRRLSILAVVALCLSLPATLASAAPAPKAKPAPGQNVTPAKPPEFLTRTFCVSNDGDECRCGPGKLCSAGDHGCACLPPAQ